MGDCEGWDVRCGSRKVDEEEKKSESVSVGKCGQAVLH